MPVMFLWTNPDVHGTCSIHLNNQMQLKAGIQSDFSVGASSIEVEAWTNIPHPGNLDDQWTGIPLHLGHSLDRGDSMIYTFEGSVVVSKRGRWRITFRARVKSKSSPDDQPSSWIWINKFREDAICTVTGAAGKQWWASSPLDCFVHCVSCDTVF